MAAIRRRRQFRGDWLLAATHLQAEELLQATAAAAALSDHSLKRKLMKCATRNLEQVD